MRLLVVSHTAHYLRGGEPAGWGATVREIDQLAEDFDEVRHLACLHRDEAPASALPYSSARVRFVPVPPAGGETLAAKLAILGRYPGYVRALWRELGRADVVHVRAPANISLLAILLLIVRRRPRLRWVKYAGNWERYPGEPATYRLQRWLLRRGWTRAAVSINGRWPGQPAHVHSFVNPCLDERDVREASGATARKSIGDPLRLVFVGRVESAKGVGTALEVVAGLRARRVPVRLDLVGDGEERPDFERRARALGIDGAVRFHGWLPRAEINPIYAVAHCMLLPSRSEGWPKVLSEAMAFGVVPVASAVGSIPHHLAEIGAGAALPPADVEAFVERLAGYWRDPAAWAAESSRAAAATPRFTYAQYRAAVRAMLRLPAMLPVVRSAPAASASPGRP